MVYSNGFGVKVITHTEQDKLKRGDFNYVALQNNSEYKLQLTNDRSTDAMAEVFIEDDQVGTWFILAKNNITIDRPANVARKFTFFRETDTRAMSAGITPGESSNGLIRVVFYPKKQKYIAIGTSPNVMIPTISYNKYNPLSGIRPSFASSTGLISPKSPMVPALPTPNLTGQVPILSPRMITASQIQSQPITSTQQAALSLKESRISPGVYPPRTTYSPRTSISAPYQSGATVLGRDSNQTFGVMERFSDDEIDWSNKTEIIIRLVVKPNVFISTVQSSSPNQWSREFVAIRTSTQPIPPRIDYTPVM